jgi:hypothetical protein
VTYQPSEIASLVLLLALGPVIMAALPRLLPKVPRSGYVAFFAMLGAYIFTIAEGFVFPDAFNMLEHVCYAVAGVAFVAFLLEFGRMFRPSSGDQR